MSNDTVEIKLDGKPIKAQKGQMIIEVTDSAGIYVPRFCYHEKLSVAANCRMCLVEVEKAPKPLPACATPVVEGMNIFTHSSIAVSAQKATMEFLLINHPLDCPICDQGGECENSLVPRKNELINENWLSDRDRFSYEGIYSTDRLMHPRIKEQNGWREIAWEEALYKLAETLHATDNNKLGILASPSATLEESYLLAKLAEQIGTNNIDHRLRRQDFSQQAEDPIFPYLGFDIADLEALDTILVIGSNIRKEAPILAHRLRKAALKGSKVCFVNRIRYDYLFDVYQYLADTGLIEQLTGIALAAENIHESIVPASVVLVGQRYAVNDQHIQVARQLQASSNSLILLGNIASRHPAYSVIRALASNIANITDSRFGFLSEGPNCAGTCLAGVLPHRQIGGKARNPVGLHAREIVGGGTETVILFGIEPDQDLAERETAPSKLAEKNLLPHLPHTLLQR